MPCHIFFDIVTRMQCPSCQTTLLLSDKQGVEIDYCPQCRGVWLDRGELDKIIDRMQQFDAPTKHSPQPSQQQEYSSQPHHKPRKKKRFDLLDELFDF